MNKQNQMPKIESLEQRVLLSGYANPIVSGQSFFFYNLLGEKVVCKLSGQGQGTWERDAQGDLYVQLTGTDYKSGFLIKGRTDIERLDVAGDIRAISAAKSDLEGTIDILGKARAIKLEDIENGEVNVNSTNNTNAKIPYLILKAGNVSGEINANMDVYSASFLSFANSEFSVQEIRRIGVKYNIQSSKVDSDNGYKKGVLKVSGDIKSSDIGNFCVYSISGNLLDSEIAAGEYTKYVSVKGCVVNSEITGNGTFEKLSVRGDFKNSSLAVLYDFGIFSDRLMR